MILRVAWACLLSGCSLYFGQSSTTTTDSTPGVDAVQGPPRLAIPCLHTLAAGHIRNSTSNEALVSFDCDAPATLEDITFANSTLTAANARNDYQDAFKRLVLTDEANNTFDVFALMADLPQLWAFAMYDGARVSFDRPFDDIWAGDLDGDHDLDFVIARDGGISIASAVQSPYVFPLEVTSADETVLASGKPFHWIAVGDFGGSAALDILYVADDAAGGIEVGLMTQTAPRTFSTQVLASGSFPGASDPPLVVADVDGDHKPDVIGAHGDLFIYESTTASLVTVPGAGAPSAVAAGDIDGDGRIDALCLEVGELRSVRFTPQGPAFHTLVEDQAADGIVAADLDSDGYADVLASHARNKPDAELVVYSGATL